MSSRSAVTLDDIWGRILAHPESVTVDWAPELAKTTDVPYARIVSKFE
jgi:predicted transcriptional regulator